MPNNYYPVADANPGVSEYFRQNPGVTGMAWGGGLNGSSPSDPRVVNLNPSLKGDANRRSVEMNERYRHGMDAMNYAPEFQITPEQREWMRGTAYGNDDNMLRHTIIARILSGDSVPGLTQEQIAESKQFSRSMPMVEPQRNMQIDSLSSLFRGQR